MSTAEQDVDKLTKEIMSKTFLNYGEAVRLAIWILKKNPRFDDESLV
jgi:hypothetical protein